jgi:hypothetical protein
LLREGTGGAFRSAAGGDGEGARMDLGGAAVCGVSAGAARKEACFCVAGDFAVIGPCGSTNAPGGGLTRVADEEGTMAGGGVGE